MEGHGHERVRRPRACHGSHRHRPEDRSPSASTDPALSAPAALAVAGVASGTGQHPAPSLPRRRLDRVRPAPGPLTAERSRALSSGMPSFATWPTGGASGAHATLSGEAQTSGVTASSLPTAPSRGSPREGTTGLTQPLGGSNPPTPVAAGGGSTGGSLGSLVTSLANQRTSEVPGVAPSTKVVGSIVVAVNEVLRAATL